MNYIKKAELLSEGFSHSQIEEMEKEETINEGELLGQAKDLVKASEIFKKLRKEYKITVNEVNTDRERRRNPAAVKDLYYKEIYFTCGKLYYRYNLRTKKMYETEEYDETTGDYPTKREMPSNFLQNAKPLLGQLAQSLQENSHKDRIYFDNNGKWKTTNPFQVDKNKYAEKLSKIKDPEEKEKKTKAAEKLISNREASREKEEAKNYAYAAKHFNY